MVMVKDEIAVAGPAAGTLSLVVLVIVEVHDMSSK